MRLIDADEFKEYIVDGFEQNKDLFTDEHRDFVKVITCGFLKDIGEQPTAFDTDKVLKKLYTIIEELGDKLEHYEILEEQGRLIELPCDVGDTVYCLAQYAVKGELTNNFFVNEIQISSFEFDGQLYIYDLNGIDYTLDDIFLTKEEAEEKLKGLRGEQNEV